MMKHVLYSYTHDDAAEFSLDSDMESRTIKTINSMLNGSVENSDAAPDSPFFRGYKSMSRIVRSGFMREDVVAYRAYVEELLRRRANEIEDIKAEAALIKSDDAAMRRRYATLIDQLEGNMAHARKLSADYWTAFLAATDAAQACDRHP